MRPTRTTEEVERLIEEQEHLISASREVIEGALAKLPGLKRELYLNALWDKVGELVIVLVNHEPQEGLELADRYIAHATRSKAIPDRLQGVSGKCQLGDPTEGTLADGPAGLPVAPEPEAIIPEPPPPPTRGHLFGS